MRNIEENCTQDLSLVELERTIVIYVCIYIYIKECILFSPVQRGRLW